MAIKIYETQIRPTSEIGEVQTTRGMRVSQATGAAIGQAIKGTAQQADVFRSQAEVIQAMNDPRYDSDPAYRQDIFNKLDRSDLNTY